MEIIYGNGKFSEALDKQIVKSALERALTTLKRLCTIANSKSVKFFIKENQDFAQEIMHLNDLASSMTVERASKVHSLWIDKAMESLIPEIAANKDLPESLQYEL